MKLQVTALQNNQRAMSDKIVKAISTPSTKESVNTLERSNVQKEVQRVLKKHNLTLEDIVIKYREIYEMKLAGTKVADVVKVLENLTKLHNLGTEHAEIDEISIMLASRNTQEIAEYTQSTLRKTEEIIARIQARRINNNS